MRFTRAARRRTAAARTRPAAGPVPASAPFSAGPSVREETVSISGGASGSAASVSSSQALSPPIAQVAAGAANASDHHRRVEQAGAVAAELDRERALAGAAVGVDVAHVVDDQDRRGEQADRHRQRVRLPAQLLGLDVVGPDDGDQAEEDEHEQLAEALVAVRPRAAGVEHAREDRRHADHEQLPAGDRRQVEARGHRDAERDVGADQHALGRHQAAGGHPHGAEPLLGVGAAAGVRVVVREVRADLDEDAADQCGDEGQRAEVVLGRRQRGADEHRRHRRGQRPRPRREQPQPDCAARCRRSADRAAHGRFGNFPKSGGRFSR